MLTKLSNITIWRQKWSNYILEHINQRRIFFINLQLVTDGSRQTGRVFCIQNCPPRYFMPGLASLLLFDYSLETLASWQYSCRIRHHNDNITFFFLYIDRHLVVGMVGRVFHHVPQQKIPGKIFLQKSPSFKLNLIPALIISPWNYWVYFALLIVFLKCSILISIQVKIFNGLIIKKS